VGAADSWAGALSPPPLPPAVTPMPSSSRRSSPCCEQYAWANMASAFVRHGCVLLCGCIADEERRADLVAAVRTVSGVRAVRDRMMVIHANPPSPSRLKGISATNSHSSCPAKCDIQ
jgi:hypothetical protein